jgi:hypothetical protein
MSKKTYKDLPVSVVRYDPKVQLNPNISDSAKVLYNYIQYRYQFFKDKEFDFCESLNRIGGTLGWSQQKVRKNMHTLRDKGYVEVIERMYRASIIKVKDQQ